MMIEIRVLDITYVTNPREDLKKQLIVRMNPWFFEDQLKSDFKLTLCISSIIIA